MAEESENHPGSSWKGKAIEQLIAAKCVLASGGRLNVSTPFVDDAGVDLVFNLRDQPRTLAIQVKSRFRSASFKHNLYRASVRTATFRARKDLALLFALYDDVEKHDLGALERCAADHLEEGWAVRVGAGLLVGAPPKSGVPTLGPH